MHRTRHLQLNKKVKVCLDTKFEVSLDLKDIGIGFNLGYVLFHYHKQFMGKCVKDG